MSTKRISAGACTVGNLVYVFGGQSEGEEFYDSIERYNCDLNLWNMLDVKLPKKLCNHFVFPFTSGV